MEVHYIMFGAFIGDIVGSKYEFNSIKTKKFPLFSRGCDYTDDTIMTVAVAKAIMLSHQEQFEKSENGKGFQEFLVEIMQDYGRRYPNPTGAYGGSFAKWLRQSNPKPYGSYGNGSAMRVSPCGLAAVTMDEALALARASACVSHNHPEGIKGAEAVSAAVFLAKSGKSKEEIRKYVSEHYYNLDFTLDSIRDSYQFDGSCQGSVPQAIVAFLESENFEDAIRNAISIGGDCDTTGAITGSIAWIYYAGYGNWVTNRFDSSMQKIKTQSMTYLPKEFIDIADEFRDVCVARAGTNYHVGWCTPILNRSESKRYRTDWGKPSVPQREDWSSQITKQIKEAMTRFCSKYTNLSFVQVPQYTLEYIIMAKKEHPDKKYSGAYHISHDKSMEKWRLRIRLDSKQLWFLSVFVCDDGRFEKYSLDKETANDSHYEFTNEQAIRKNIYAPGDEKKYFHEILARYVQANGGEALLSQIMPYVTAQFHF